MELHNKRQRIAEQPEEKWNPIDTKSLATNLRASMFHIIIDTYRKGSPITHAQWKILLTYISDSKCSDSRDKELFRELKRKVPDLLPIGTDVEKFCILFNCGKHELGLFLEPIQPNTTVEEIFLYALFLRFRFCCDNLDSNPDIYFTMREMLYFQLCYVKGLPRATYQLLCYIDYRSTGWSLNQRQDDPAQQRFLSDLVRCAKSRSRLLLKEAVKLNDPDALYQDGLNLFQSARDDISMVAKAANRFRRAYLNGHFHSTSELRLILASWPEASDPLGDWCPQVHKWCSPEMKTLIRTTLLVLKRCNILKELNITIVGYVCSVPLENNSLITHRTREIESSWIGDER